MARLDVLTEELERRHLYDGWQRWVGVVEDFARRTPRRRDLVEADYAALHRGLLAECRQAADSASVEPERYERMHALAAPWLSTIQLEEASPVLLTDLLRQCGEVRRPPGRAWRPRAADGGARTAWLVLLGLVVMLLALAGAFVLDLAGVAQGGWFWLRRNLAEVSFEQWLVMGGLAAVLLVSLLVMRTRQR